MSQVRRHSIFDEERIDSVEFPIRCYQIEVLWKHLANTRIKTRVIFVGVRVNAILNELSM